MHRQFSTYTYHYNFTNHLKYFIKFEEYDITISMINKNESFNLVFTLIAIN